MDGDTAAPWTQQEHLVIISLYLPLQPSYLTLTVTQLDRSNKADLQSVGRSEASLEREVVVLQLSETQRSHGGVDPA